MKLKCYSDFNKTWITPDILKSIHRKNSLKHRSQSSLSKYKTYKNKLTSIIRAADKFSYETKFDIAKDTIKKTWKLIKGIIKNELENKQTLLNEIKSDDKILTDKFTISNKFNDFCNNVGQNLAKKIPEKNEDVIKYIKENYPNSMVFNSTDQNELWNMVITLRNTLLGVMAFPHILLKLHLMKLLTSQLSFLMYLSVSMLFLIYLK